MGQYYFTTGINTLNSRLNIRVWVSFSCIGRIPPIYYYFIRLKTKKARAFWPICKGKKALGPHPKLCIMDNMKRFTFLFICVTAGLLSAACGQERLPKLNFSGQTYQLAFSTQEPAGRINEYLLPGEDLERYSKMIGVYTFPTLKDKTPQEAIKLLSAYMVSSNSMTSYETHESKDKNAAIIDFLVFSPGATMAEYNVFKYVKEGENMKSLQFVARWYASRGDGALENARNFATSYLENRQEWVKKVDDMRIPKIYEQDYSIDPSLYVEEEPAAVETGAQPQEEASSAQAGAPATPAAETVAR